MQALSFFPTVDLPLVALTTCGFILNFRLWAESATDELGPYLRSRLLGAILRVIGFFTLVLVLCWYFNVAVWGLFAIVFCIALAAMILSGDAYGLDLAMVLSGGILREWCFGFPQLILRPQPDNSRSSALELRNKLIGNTGTTTSPLRPAGNVSIDGNEFAAASDDGTLIDAGQKIIVVGTKNGAILVKTLAKQENGG